MKHSNENKYLWNSAPIQSTSKRFILSSELDKSLKAEERGGPTLKIVNVTSNKKKLKHKTSDLGRVPHRRMSNECESDPPVKLDDPNGISLKWSGRQSDMINQTDTVLEYRLHSRRNRKNGSSCRFSPFAQKELSRWLCIGDGCHENWWNVTISAGFDKAMTVMLSKTKLNLRAMSISSSVMAQGFWR